jgi:hypothetical protein
MSRPIALASSGYLATAEISPLHIATDGYLGFDSIPIPPERTVFDPGQAIGKSMFRLRLEREDNEILQIIMSLGASV